MSVLIYDSTSQAYKDTGGNKIYSSGDSAFVDAGGKVWNSSEWVDALGGIPLNDGLIHAWFHKKDDGTDEIGDVNVTLTNGTIDSTGGPDGGKCLRILANKSMGTNSTTNYLQFPHSEVNPLSDVSSDDTVTVSVWGTFNNSSSDSYYGQSGVPFSLQSIERNIVTWNGWNIWMFSRFQRMYRFNRESSESSSIRCTEINTLTPNEWHHIVMMVSKSNAVVYVDGVPKTTTIEFSLANFTTQYTPWRLMFCSLNVLYNGGYTTNSAGTKTAKLRIYNRALTENEVLQLYNNKW